MIRLLSSPLVVVLCSFFAPGLNCLGSPVALDWPLSCWLLLLDCVFGDCWHFWVCCCCCCCLPLGPGSSSRSFNSHSTNSLSASAFGSRLLSLVFVFGRLRRLQHERMQLEWVPLAASLSFLLSDKIGGWLSIFAWVANWASIISGSTNSRSLARWIYYLHKLEILYGKKVRGLEVSFDLPLFFPSSVTNDDAEARKYRRTDRLVGQLLAPAVELRKLSSCWQRRRHWSL